MARIRTVKPELFRHHDLYEAEVASELPLRLAFIGLFTVCDREGRFKWRPHELKLDVLPYDTFDMAQVLDALATRGFVHKYRVGDGWYGCIPSFSNHQIVNNREKASILPKPTGEEGGVPYKNSVLDEDGAGEFIAVDDPCVTGHTPAQEEGEGEGEGSKKSIPPVSPQGGAKPNRARKASKGKRKSSFPTKLAAVEALRHYFLAYARDQNLVLTGEPFEAFQNHHTAKGSVMMDWQAAARTWIGNSKRFGGQVYGVPRTHTGGRPTSLAHDLAQEARDHLGHPHGQTGVGTV
ncbi:hypothetical protein [Magnetococcus sp. PR-3]|uniref:hypothetical protein n=1 Tax=Magnetococcus sp. PR-3 TaxID=3120355 RepID=UPI002FCE3F18